MDKIKLLTIAVISLLLINIGTLTFVILKKPVGPPVPGHEHRGGPRGEGPKKIIIERLNFDEGQRKQYELLIEEHRTKMHELNEASTELHDELYSQLKENIADTAKANMIIQQIAANQKALDMLNFDHFKKIKAICKPEQLERFSGLVEDLTRIFQPHGEPPRGGPPR